jgi:hypothetical protein
MWSQYPGAIDIRLADKVERAFRDFPAILVGSNTVRQAGHLRHQQIGE